MQIIHLMKCILKQILLSEFQLRKPYLFRDLQPKVNEQWYISLEKKGHSYPYFLALTWIFFEKNEH